MKWESGLFLALSRFASVQVHGKFDAFYYSTIWKNVGLKVIFISMKKK